MIGPKTWDRVVGILGLIWTIRNSAETDLGCLCWKLCIKLYCDVYEMGNDNGIRFQKVEPRLDEWAAHGQPTAGFWDC